jgi:hypothetical protein
VLRARLDGTQVILEWTGVDFALQETDALTTPIAWQNSALPVTSQTVNGEVRQQAAADASGGGTRKFFRLAE